MTSFVITVVLPVVGGQVHYLHNSIFPPLLTAAEEAEQLRLLAEGDAEARSCLIERNLRLVAHIVKKFENSEVERDDLLSLWTIGLIKGISTFRAERGVRLATYAARCIENEILMHLRSIRNQRSDLSLYDTVGVDKEGGEIRLIDVLSGGEDDIQQAIEQEESVAAMLRCLPLLDEQESLVIRCRYGLNGGERLTQRQIASRLGISRSYVSRIEKRALSRLRQEMVRLMS